MTYTIRFPIGDWSDDGHGKCKYFMVKSNMPVKQVREIHFLAPTAVGFNIGQMCSDYECSSLDADIVEKLLAIGIDPKKYGMEDDDDDYWMEPESLVDIWIDILKYINTGLDLERITKNDYEDINFYGNDDKNRHLETPGYGVF